jgi:hypothetical protein
MRTDVCANEKSPRCHLAKETFHQVATPKMEELEDEKILDRGFCTIFNCAIRPGIQPIE